MYIYIIYIIYIYNIYIIYIYTGFNFSCVLFCIRFWLKPMFFLMASSMLVTFQWAEFYCNVSFGATGFNTIKSGLCKGTPFCTEPLEVLFPQAQTQFKKIATIWAPGSSLMVTHWAGMAIDLATLDGDKKYVIIYHGTSHQLFTPSCPHLQVMRCHQSPFAFDKASSIGPIFLPPPAAWNLNAQKITLHMCIKWQDLGRFGLQSARFENTFLEGWEPKYRPFHAWNTMRCP